jgi:hypothetical protein
VPTFRPTALAALLLTGVAVAPAVANPIAVTFGDTVNMRYLGVNPGHGGDGLYNWSTGNTTYSGLVYADPAHNTLGTFCVERSQPLASGMQPYELVQLTQAPTGQHMSAATADALRMMWAEYFDDVDTSDEAAAFQNAVWHLVDGSYDSPYATGSAVDDLFHLYLNASTWNSGRANLGVLSSGTLQDQLVQLTPDAVETPEPSLLALGLLVLPAVYLRRRFAKA